VGGDITPSRVGGICHVYFRTCTKYYPARLQVYKPLPPPIVFTSFPFFLFILTLSRRPRSSMRICPVRKSCIAHRGDGRAQVAFGHLVGVIFDGSFLVSPEEPTTAFHHCYASCVTLEGEILSSGWRGCMECSGSLVLCLWWEEIRV
jgi:hypothetical protein